MTLNEMLQTLSLPPCAQNPQVLGVTHNSAWVKQGFVFVAIRGLKHDGHQFIDTAIQNGAVAVVGEGYDHTLTVPYIQVPNARQALADLACEFYQHPSKKMRVVGVTGTDGKSTTSWMVYHLLKEAGHRTGLLSTVGYRMADGSLHHFPQHFSTPESPEIQRILSEMLAEGISHVVLETSSHALELERVRGIDFRVGIFTNVSPEHLDFHGDMEGYFHAKRKLIDSSEFAILNAENPYTMRLKTHTNYVTFGTHKVAHWQAMNIKTSGMGFQFDVFSPLGNFKADLPMIGRFNLENALAAMAAAFYLGVSVKKLQAGIASFSGVPGRMQILSQKPRVIVDFAHTPPSLEKALSVVRTSTKGKLWVVLGSAGGNRDSGKRAPLGEVASQFADHAIFTEEDSRDTPIWDILHEMQRGAATTGRHNYTCIPEREAAIQHAIMNAMPEDTVLLAGKGPEDTLERANETLPWDEVTIAEKYLDMRFGQS